MSHRNRRSVGGLRNKGAKKRSLVELLEQRQLLSAASFGTPISTALPNSFVPVNLIPTIENNSDVFTNGYIVTNASGGGLLLHANNDGTFNTVQPLTTSATILGATEDVSNSVPTVITTAGAMARQGNGTFSAPNNLTLPSDSVAGTSFWDGHGDQVIVERFHPNNGDPTKGSVILATFKLQQDGTFGSETDTTILTNVAPPPANVALWHGDLTTTSTPT